MSVDLQRLKTAYATCRNQLLEHLTQHADGTAFWTGELSTSALSTATAVMALHLVSRAGHTAVDYGIDRDFSLLIGNGLRWLAKHQNEDGGWGDTVKSLSNISTTMLAHAVFHATGSLSEFSATVERAKSYIERSGGIPAVRARYGKDHTFSVPILTHCALAGLVDWREVPSLPFELACLPARFYKTVRLPVVSYALPALIAIGQVRFHFRPTRNPMTRLARKLALQPSLRVLDRIQPPNGGFLEATPLTSFVTMSLAGMGLVDHPVVRRAVGFLCRSARPDGSWPIDTNLATWVTTLSINALKDGLPESARPGLLNWLLAQQYREVHPYTNADPGGWAWTDLPGGVPDGDDTPGAILAILQLWRSALVTNAEERALSDFSSARPEEWGEGRGNAFGWTDADRQTYATVTLGIRWLLGLQNHDGGFPTFCRGWGKLAFDRSSADITAHCLRSVKSWSSSRLSLDEWCLRVRDAEHPDVLEFVDVDERDGLEQSVVESIQRAFKFLRNVQRPDGSWVPLWFGNQHAFGDENPVYGTSRVLMAYRDCEHLDRGEAQRGARFLAGAQNRDGGWGGAAGIPSTVEETALAVEVLLSFQEYRKHAFGGIRWLIERVEDGSVSEPSPIGFYFAKLWYFERLYPLIFTVSALRQALETSPWDQVTLSVAAGDGGD